MRQSLEEAKNKALDKEEAKIIHLTSLVSIFEEKVVQAKEVV